MYVRYSFSPIGSNSVTALTASKFSLDHQFASSGWIGVAPSVVVTTEARMLRANTSRSR
jgi:hypothetical protein